MSEGDDQILVVEDDPQLLPTTVAMLEEGGYSAVGVSDGYAALKIFRENRDTIQLAIVDLGLPGINGAEVVAVMRKIKPELPVVIVTGYLVHESLGGLRRLERCSFLAKPYLQQQLSTAVSTMLSK